MSEGLLFLVPIVDKRWQITPLSRKFEFPAYTYIKVNNLFKFSAQASDLVPFVAYGIKDKIPSEIKPPSMEN